MSEFNVYLKLGYQHILDINGYDHILFVIALCSIYLLEDWKKVLILVTAFTLGHSVTLALATLNLVNFSSDVIEFLIPVTILITAVSNFFIKHDRALQRTGRSRTYLRYTLAGFFGLVHGLGFSNYLRSLLSRSESITSKLLAFNIGIELGQIVIVLVTLLLSYVLINLLKVPRREWNLIVSGIVAGIAIRLITESSLLAG
jgi:uncharacterized membrane protein YfcA